MTKLEQIAAGLDDGPMWFRGRLLKDFVAAYMEDRAVLAAGCGNEIPTASGRQFIIARTNQADAPADALTPFQGYHSPYTGTGTPPATQQQRVRVRLGTVNGRAPTNINQEIFCTLGTAQTPAVTLVWVKAEFGPHAEYSGSVIDHGPSMPAEPAGAVNLPPDASYRLLFQASCDDKGVVLLEQAVVSSLDVHPVCISVTCDGNLLEYQWTSA